VSGPTDESEATLLDHYTGKQPYSVPTWYVGLSSTTPTDAGGSFTEPSAGGYQRVALTAASWTAATGGDPSSTSYGATLSFPVSTGGWGGLSHFGLFSQSSGGSVQAWGTLSSALSVGTGDRPVFAANSLRVRLGDPPDFLVGGGFVPTDITGCVLWLDASDTGTITEASGAVSQIDDKSSAGNHATQGTGSAQPTTGTRTQNGLNVLDFDGTGDYLSSALTASDRTQTVFGVWLLDTINGDDMGLLGSAGGTGGRQVQFRTDTNRISVVKSWVAVLGDYSVAAMAASTPYVSVTAIGDANFIQSLNDSAEETDTESTTFTAARTTVIGTDAGNGLFGYLNGWIAEIVVYDTQLGLDDRATVRDYLNAKWAVY
jgi:hypothetical protein